MFLRVKNATLNSSLMSASIFILSTFFSQSSAGSPYSPSFFIVSMW